MVLNQRSVRKVLHTELGLKTDESTFLPIRQKILLPPALKCSLPSPELGDDVLFLLSSEKHIWSVGENDMDSGGTSITL